MERGRLAPLGAPGPRLRFDRRVALVVALGGLVYVGTASSPSSYAIVVQALGAPETGLRLGQPRPERGDEFGAHTPLLQMAVRNGFRRFATVAPYPVDLRTLYAVPLLDWGLVFKPSLWAFLVAPPAYAFSFNQYLLIASFVVGWGYLFVALGIGRRESLLLSLGAFFTAYTQYWWAGWGNVLLSTFPWVALAWLSRLPWLARTALVYWLTVSWLLVLFYPPVALSLAFVGMACVLALRPGALTWRTVSGAAVAAGAAVATVWLYLRDALAVLGRTHYPGSRYSGGGGVTWTRWLSQFLPTVQVDHHTLLVPGNVCEEAMIGTCYALLVACFLDFRGLARRPRARWPLVVLLAACLMTQAWMLLPLPWWAGAPFLWHRVTPGRLVVAAGLLILVLSAVAARRLGLRVSWVRFAVFAALVTSAWYVFKRGAGWGGWIDLAILAPVAGIVWLRKTGRWHERQVDRGFLTASLLLGLLAFADYNPLQSSRPIFERPDTVVTRGFDLRLRDGCTAFVIPFHWSFFGHTGSPLLGYGYPSIAHTTFEPKLAFWKRLFPGLPPDEFHRVFNNVGTFAVSDRAEPARPPGTILTLAPLRTVLRDVPGACLMAGGPRALTDGAYKAAFAVEGAPAAVAPGSRFALPVRVRNVGSDIWPDPPMADPTQPGAYAVRLTYRWLSPGLQTDWLDRVELSRPVLPGEEQSLVVHPLAPQAPGRYELELGLVQELVAHFGERGSRGPRIPVEVR